MIPEQCSFSVNGLKCLLPPEFIIEINTDKNDNFMIGLTCLEHRQFLEEKFLKLQNNGSIPKGKIVFTKIKVIHTNCIKGNQEDIDEINLRRI